MSFLDELIQHIEVSIDENAVNNFHQGGIIASGFNAEIDKDRALVSKGYTWIAEYSDKLREDSGVKVMKIKYTNAAGYFIEIPKSFTGILPEYFLPKQTLTNASRYTTAELKKFEGELQRATDTLNEKEYSCFIEIRNNIIDHFEELYKLSGKVGYFDFLVSSSACSLQNRYISPKVTQSKLVDIDSGRHPVIEGEVREFISNDLKIGSKDMVHTITGPNMGGKSTFLRQNALIIIMAHMGVDVPARDAKIGLCDRVFSRVGAGDNLFLGQSTFMLEMQEISFILQNATDKSFIIIDEIGRGTSTFDGMSLAWSILKYIHDQLESKTLFATHYHEIIDYTSQLNKASNYSVAVGENEDNIVFLRKVIQGGVKKSYGIEVAKIAGIPNNVLDQAKITMKKLESQDTQQQLQIGYKEPPESVGTTENNKLFKELELRINSINLNNTSPIQGLLIIEELKKLLKKTK